MNLGLERAWLVRRLAFSALLGIVTSIAVAWGAAVWAHERGAVRQVQRGAAVLGTRLVRLVVIEQAAWRTERWSVRDLESEAYDIARVRDQARRITQLGGAAVDEKIRTEGQSIIRSIGRTPPDFPEVERIDSLVDHDPAADISTAEMPPLGLDLATFDAGWPFLAMGFESRSHIVEGPPNAMGLPSSFTPSVEHSGAIRISRGRVAAGQPPDEVLLPIHARPGGFIADIVVFGSLWGALFIVPRIVRGVSRRSRGCCPACGYELSQLPVGCPECGWNRTTS